MQNSQSKLLLWCVAIAVFALLYGRWDLLAQDPAEPAANPAVAADPEAPDDAGATPAEGQSLGMLVVKSGMFSIVFYVVLGLFSLVALMVGIERLVNLTRAKVAPPEITAQLNTLIDSGQDNYQNLKALAERSPTPLSRILKAGVQRAGRPLPEVEKAMEDAALREAQALRSRNRPLVVVGNIAPLVGLLGTVVGMIFAFGTASGVGLGQGEELAKGIYLALMTTAGGLSIAIPAMLVSAWLGARVERFMHEIGDCVTATLPAFARMEGSVDEGAFGRDRSRGQESNAAREAVSVS